MLLKLVNCFPVYRIYSRLGVLIIQGHPLNPKNSILSLSRVSDRNFSGGIEKNFPGTLANKKVFSKKNPLSVQNVLA